jgi:hypothetical protein
LDSTFVDRITLSGITTDSSNLNAGFFSISEIEIAGAPIPEPTAALLFGTGFGVVGIATRRRRLH